MCMCACVCVRVCCVFVLCVCVCVCVFQCACACVHCYAMPSPIRYTMTPDPQVSDRLVVPVVPRGMKPYLLQRDTELALALAGVDPSCMLSLEAVPIEQAKVAQVTLVDHHTPDTPLTREQVVEVIDHHEDPPQYGPATRVEVQAVGSCSSLVAARFIEVEVPQPVATLLLSAIVLDTWKLQSERTSALDREAVERLSDVAAMTESELFEELRQQRFGRHGDSLAVLLRRDAKVEDCGGSKVILSTVTCPSSEVLVDSEFVASTREWLSSEGACLGAVLFVWLPEQGGLEREVVLCGGSGGLDLLESMATVLAERLGCQQVEGSLDDEIVCLSCDSHVTRKLLLPVIVQAVQEM